MSTENQGPEVQQDGSVCSFFVQRPVLTWYHGNQLRNGELRDGARPYALLHDDSLPLVSTRRAFLGSLGGFLGGGFARGLRCDDTVALSHPTGET